MITKKKVKIYKFKADDNKFVARVTADGYEVLEVLELTSYKELVEGKDKKDCEDKVKIKKDKLKKEKNK